MKINNYKQVLLSVFAILFFAAQSVGADMQQQLDSLANLLKKANFNDSIEVITEIGRVYYKNDDNVKALESFYLALRLNKKGDDEKVKATLINNIAAVYYNIDDLESALSNFIQSYELEKQLNNKLGVSKSLNNIAIIYNEMERYDESLNYYNKSLEIRKELGDEEGIATIHNNMGLVFIKKKDYKKAIAHYEISVKISVEHENFKSVANTYSNIARAYTFLEEYDKAKLFINKSFTYTEGLEAIFIEKDNYMTLYTIYKEEGNFKLALKHYEKFEFIEDSLNSLKINANINELKLKYESEKKEQENVLLKSERDKQQAFIKMQNILVVGIGLVLLLVSILAFVMYKNAVIRKKSFIKLHRQKEEIEKKNAELRKLNQIKNKIFSVISHEVRSPLNSLLGTVELLTSGYLSPEEFFELSSDLKQKVNQTTIFLNNILIWAKTQMQGIAAKKENFIINDLINETLDLLKEQADIKGVEIVRNFENELFVNADRNMIGIVVKNLIANAIKFTNKGQKVTIDSIKNGKFVIVKVCDQGVGISKENQQKILGSENISTVGTAQEVGTGLGLVLSKNFVEENGGSLWMESEEGEGSTFSFTVPLN